MKAKKLPSGNWRVQVYSHTDSSGKKVRQSFTASTKAEAEMLAAKFKADTDRRRSDDLTIKEAVKNYLEANENVLSSSTIYNYKKDAKSFQSIEHLKIRKLTSNDLQRFISSLVDQGLSPKTIKNRYGLLRTVLTYCGVEKKYVIHLPSQPRKPKYAPEDEQIKRLYDEANRNMKVAIMLAAFHSLRRYGVLTEIVPGRIYQHLKTESGKRKRSNERRGREKSLPLFLCELLCELFSHPIIKRL